jgi:hypothetical protein
MSVFAKEISRNLAGAFPDVVGKPTGPTCITHTHYDLACTLAYPLASRRVGRMIVIFEVTSAPFSAKKSAMRDRGARRQTG